MQAEKRILVVGTTADYIHWIQRSYPGTALFLTDPLVRRTAREPAPPPDSEIRCQLASFDQSEHAIRTHLGTYSMQLSGVVSFDCESMALAASLARQFGLPFPSPEAIQNCRDKFLTKTIWHQNRLNTPLVRLVGSNRTTG
jgi:hypothetical protein